MTYHISSWNKLHKFQPPGTVPRNKAFLIYLTLNSSLREWNNSELLFLQIYILQIANQKKTGGTKVCNSFSANYFFQLSLHGHFSPRKHGSERCAYWFRRTWALLSLKQYLQKIASISKGKYTKNLMLRQKKEKTKFTMLKRL